MNKHIEASFEKAINPEYDATFVVSASNADRVKDTIAPEAYIPNLEKRLPALFGHDHDKIIGTWENLRLEGKNLIGDIKLAGTDLAKMVKQLLVDNVPLMTSIGFRGNGDKNSLGGYHYKSIDLYEISVVAVGMHQDAVRIAKTFNIELDFQSENTLAIKADAVAKAKHALTIIHK